MLGRYISTFFGVLLLFLLVSCDTTEPNYAERSYQLMEDHAKYMYKQHSMLLRGIGGGFLEQVTELGLSFVAMGDPSVEEARMVYVQTSQRFLDSVNDDEKLRGHLKNGALTIDDLTYHISYKLPPDTVSQYDYGPIDFISCVNGIVRYKRASLDSPLRYETIHSEPYEEAKRIVNGETN